MLIEDVLKACSMGTVKFAGPLSWALAGPLWTSMSTVVVAVTPQASWALTTMLGNDPSSQKRSDLSTWMEP